MEGSGNFLNHMIQMHFLKILTWLVSQHPHLPSSLGQCLNLSPQLRLPWRHAGIAACH